MIQSQPFHTIWPPAGTVMTALIKNELRHYKRVGTCNGIHVFPTCNAVISNGLVDGHLLQIRKYKNWERKWLSDTMIPVDKTTLMMPVWLQASYLFGQKCHCNHFRKGRPVWAKLCFPYWLLELSPVLLYLAKFADGNLIHLLHRRFLANICAKTVLFVAV